MNLKQLLEQSARRYPERPALRFKAANRWCVRTYAELLSRARAAAARLAAHGVRKGDRVALIRENTPDWPELYFGIVGAGAMAVPVDPRLKEQEVAHILADSGTSVVVAAARAHPLLREIEDRLSDLRLTLLTDGDPPPRSPGRIPRLAWNAEMAHPSGEGAWDRVEVTDDDIASLIYTSGTTGRQKGAMLSHGNFTSNALSCTEAITVRPDDNFLLALPLFHSFAFTANLIVPLAAGASISFVENLKTVGENMREVSPTVLMAVPLLLDKLYRRLRAGIEENAVARLLSALGIMGPVKRRVAERLGGALRLIASGGAPCDPELLIGLHRLGVLAIEGYGLTETAPVVSLNLPPSPRAGTVGRALPGVEVRILDPDGAGVGEIAVRGPNVMKGYWRNPAATAEVLRDGWFATGDLGLLDAEGRLAITGRKKALIVNREGKNIYPEEVEQLLGRSPFILEALVIGYHEPGAPGEKIGVIVVPNQQALDELGHRRGSPLTEAECEERVRSEVRVWVQQIAEYKRPRRVVIRAEEFEKTSTGKIKRYLYNFADARPL